MHPLTYVLESLPIGHIIYYDNAMSSSVVAGRQRSEPLLPRCVPNLQFNILPVKLNSFDLEVYSNRVEKVLVE